VQSFLKAVVEVAVLLLLLLLLLLGPLLWLVLTQAAAVLGPELLPALAAQGLMFQPTPLMASMVPELELLLAEVALMLTQLQVLVALPLKLVLPPVDLPLADAQAAMVSLLLAPNSMPTSSLPLFGLLPAPSWPDPSC
jgi:hypothetical protein